MQRQLCIHEEGLRRINKIEDEGEEEEEDKEGRWQLLGDGFVLLLTEQRRQSLLLRQK